MKGILLVLLLGGLLLFAGCCGATHEYTPGSPNITSNAPAQPTEKLEILEHHMVMENGTFMTTAKVVGTAKNIGGVQLSYAEVRARFYDADGVLLDSSLDNINDLGPDQVWAFEILYPSLNASAVSRYDISVGTVLP